MTRSTAMHARLYRALAVTRHAARVVSLALVVVWLGTPPLVAQQEPSAASEPPVEAEAGLWAEVVALYESAREAGEDVSKDIYEWVTEDLQGVGDWEYHVLELDAADPVVLEEQLNKLGTERWDCIWIEARGETTRFIFKRPARTYLQHIPLTDLMKVIPGGGAGDGGS